MAATSLSYKFKTANIIVKIVAINAVIFLAVNLVAFFMDVKPFVLTQWFVLPDTVSEFITQPWAFFTYGFLHFGFWHLLFNMIWLNFFGKFVLNIFNEKRFLTIYLLGTLFGGILFVLSYNLFPVFSETNGYLLGASGAVTAIMIFIATYTPNTAFRIFTWTIKLWQIAVFLFLLDLVRLPASDNAGGLLAHVGGAIFGYVYAVQLAKGNDIGKWFENILGWFTDLFKPRTKKPFKKVHRTTRTTSSRSTTREQKSDHQRKVDGILDKIGKSGYESLTKGEKDFLFKAGKED